MPASVVRAAATELTLLAPVHAAGTVDIVVTNPDGQSGRLVGAFVYEHAPAGAPVVTTISPTVVVTTGGAWVEIRGTGLHFATSVTLDGVVMRAFPTPSGSLEFATPPHAAGPVDLVVTNPDGQAILTRAFTYAPPETFNFNGTWKGLADGPPESVIEMSFTIADNALVSVSCGSATVTLSPAPPISGGEFSFVGEAGLTLKGRMLSPTTAIGEIHALPCSPTWYAKNSRRYMPSGPKRQTTPSSASSTRSCSRPLPFPRDGRVLNASTATRQEPEQSFRGRLQWNYLCT